MGNGGPLGKTGLTEKKVGSFLLQCRRLATAPDLVIQKAAAVYLVENIVGASIGKPELYVQSKPPKYSNNDIAISRVSSTPK